MRFTIPMTREQTKDLMHEALESQNRKKRYLGTDREAEALHDVFTYLMGMRRVLVVLGQQDICDINNLLDEWADEEEE